MGRLVYLPLHLVSPAVYCSCSGMTCLDPNLSIHKASFGPWVGGVGVCAA